MVAQNHELRTMSRHRSVTSGLSGWWKRFQWKRQTLGLTEVDIDALHKRIVILDRQLEVLPTASSVYKRRMQLLEERERCVTIISTWEERYDSSKQPVEDR